MGRDPIVLVRAFMAEHNPPLRVWVAPGAGALLPRSAEVLPEHAELVHLPTASPIEGPAILLATAADIMGPQREALLAYGERARPGRPVICGGTADRELLMDAINSWHVFHMLPSHPSHPELADAVLRAHQACALEHAATLCADQLRARCDDLQQVMSDLVSTRELLLEAERFTAVSGFSRALAVRLRQHLERLRALERALCTQPDDLRRAELLDFTMQSIHEIEALLADLLHKAEAAEPSSPAAQSREGKDSEATHG